MKFKHAFCFLSLIFVTLLSCKKDLDDQLFIENSATVERNLAQLESQQQRDFFDRYFLTSNNPHILPSLQGRNGEDSLINAVYEYVLNLELESDVVEGLVDAVGFPVWNHSTIVEEVGNPNYKVVLTPFARLNEDHISGYAASFPHGWGSATSSEFYILVFERSKIKSYVLANHPHEDSLALGFHVATHYNFDEELFGTVDSDFTTWMSTFPPEDGDGFNDGISSRNNYVTLWGLIPCYAFGPPNGGVEERAGCYDFYNWSSNVPCGPGNNNGNSGSGSGIGNFINNEGGGGSGPNNTITLSNYIQDCQAILAAQEPGGVPPSNIENADNPAMIQQCENYFTVSNALNLSEEELLWLINEGMLGTIAFMLDNEEINQDAILPWIGHKRGDGPHLSFRQFEALYNLVVNNLQPQLGLSQSEVDFLFGHSADGLASQINTFLESHPNDDLAVIYANVVIDETSNQQVWGETNIASLNLFDGYDELKAYLDAETDEQVTEIQNGINIIETYLSGAPQEVPTSATMFGGSASNPNGGPDLESDTDRDYSIFDLAIQPTINAPESVHESLMKTLLYTATGINGMQHIASNYMSKFKNNPTVFDYYNSSLSTHVMESINMRNWLKDYGYELNERLKEKNGEINDVIPPEIPRPAMNENMGFTLLINDTQKVNTYLLDSWDFDSTTGAWEGYFMVNLVDHFGLDDDDAVDYQYSPGFVSWWALQYRKGWHPFKTDIWFVVQLGGNINN